MRNSRLLVGLLASAALALSPLGANAATIGTVIGNVQLAASTTPTFNTTGAAASGTLVVLGIATINTVSTPTVSGCTFTPGANTAPSSARYAIFYCTSAGISSGAAVSWSLGASVPSVACMAFYPATVTTHDAASGMSSGNSGSGTSITATTGTASNASEILITGAEWNNFGDISQDASSAGLCADEGSGVVGGNLAERVLTSTASVTSTMGLTSTLDWVTSWDAFLFTPGGGGSNPAIRARQGYGQ
jgi:hypothetical protein